VAEGEECGVELFLLEAEEEVGLVFFGVDGLEEGGASGGVALDAGVVAGGDVGGAEGAGFGEEVAEFEFFVADDAGVGGASGAVFAGEVVDDHAFEFTGFIDDVMGDAEGVGDAAGVGDGLGAAAFVFGAGDAVLGPDFHGDADDVIALFFEEVGGDGGVDASAHAEEDAGLGRGTVHGLGSMREKGRETKEKVVLRTAVAAEGCKLGNERIANCACSRFPISGVQ
jgi:hypothetical protein